MAKLTLKTTAPAAAPAPAAKQKLKVTLTPTPTAADDAALERAANQDFLAKEDRTKLRFINSGCTTLNLALTGFVNWGYPIGRIVNVVGDYSTGKTLLACEAVNSVFYIEEKLLGKKVKVYYDEPEASFDLDLGKQFNMPLERIIGLRESLPGYKPTKGEHQFKPSRTVEDFFNNVKGVLQRDKDYDVVLYVLDSLDAVSDTREMERIESKGVESADFQGRKGAVMSQLFRSMIYDIRQSNVLVLVVSQIRDKLNVTFGKKKTRSGGNALNFYASQIMWLYEMSEIKTADKVVTGIEVRAEVDKNKVAKAHRSAIFNIVMGWGIDDISSMVEFLWDADSFEKNGSYLIWEGKNRYKSELIKMAEEDSEIVHKLKGMCQETWNAMEERAIVKTKPKWGGD